MNMGSWSAAVCKGPSSEALFAQCLPVPVVGCSVHVLTVSSENPVYASDHLFSHP